MKRKMSVTELDENRPMVVRITEQLQNVKEVKEIVL
jgi:hypothetical protein